MNINHLENIQKHPTPSSTESLSPSFIVWIGRKIKWIGEKLDPLSSIIQGVAYILFPLAASCVVFTSSRSFKRKCDQERVTQSRKILEELGGEQIFLKMPDGHHISAMYLDQKKCLDRLLSKGAEKGILTHPDDLIEDVLWIPSQKEELIALIEKMKLPLFETSGRLYLPLGIPKKIFESFKNNDLVQENGTVIYAPGSGHLFEFRRRTIGSFLIGYGMNMLVLNYTGTGKSEGKITEQLTYDDMERVYHYLVNDKGIPDHKILGYGHCMGSGPAIDLASKHQINLLVDRACPTMGEFAKLRVVATLGLPSCLQFLASWIEPVMNRCFFYNNREKISHVKGGVAVLGAKHDEMIPPKYIDELFDRAVLAKNKVKISMNTNHDADLTVDETTRLALGQFLGSNQLI